MGELFSGLSAFMVFMAIAALGFLFLLVALIFGEIFEHLGSDGDSDLGHGGPSFFSGRVMSVFITAFGGAGAVATTYGLGTVAASGAGFLTGLFFATLIYSFARFLFGQQASTQVDARDLEGRPARVTVAIPANGVGQVRLQIGEEMVDKIARSKTGAAIAENTLVVIEQVLGELAVVRPQD